MTAATEVGRPVRRAGGAWVGLTVALALMAAATAVPPLTGWDVHTHVSADGQFAPLHSTWDPKLRLATLAVLALAWAGWRNAFGLADRLGWRRLLVLAF